MRITVVSFLALLCLAPGLSRAEGPFCERLLTSKEEVVQALDAELTSAIGDMPAIQRLYARLKSKSAKDRVLKNCLEKGCTHTELGRAVRELVAMQPQLKNAIGYGFLLGVMVANSAMSAEVTTLVNSQASFLPTFVASFFGQLSFVGLSLMAPYLEPLASRIRRSTFAAVKGTTNETPSDLESQADAVNATYTLREQHASDRILSLRTAILLNLDVARIAIENGDEAGLVAQLADAMMAGYRHFRDLDPADPTIVSAIRATLLRKISDPAKLTEPILAYIQSHDQPGTGREEQLAQKYYRKAIRAWLGGNT